MIGNKRLLIGVAALFAVTECVLSVLLQTAEGRMGAYFSYAVVVLACLFCGVFAERSAAYGLTQLALITTVCADYFLVFSVEQKPLPAMFFFSFTQLAYFGRLYLADRSLRRRRVQLAAHSGASIFALVLTVAVLGAKTDALSLVSLFYYANLLLNIVFAFLLREKPPLFAVGLLLFACCDTLIGLSMLGEYLPVSSDAVIYRIVHPGFNLAWVFYVPSQALLALSLLPKRLCRMGAQ